MAEVGFLEDLEFIASRSADDDDRIERMKDLLIDAESLSPTQRSQIASILTDIVVDASDDVVVRQHAANEIGYYMEAPTTELKQRFENPDEDIDIRYNLQASFRDHFSC